MKELTDTSGPIRPKRAHAYLSTFYAWLIHNNQCGGANPCMGIKLGKEEPRSRTLSEPELVDVWLAAGEAGLSMRSIHALGGFDFGGVIEDVGLHEWCSMTRQSWRSAARSFAA